MGAPEGKVKPRQTFQGEIEVLEFVEETSLKSVTLTMEREECELCNSNVLFYIKKLIQFGSFKLLIKNNWIRVIFHFVKKCEKEVIILKKFCDGVLKMALIVFQ